jgi:hypothetical protein
MWMYLDGWRRIEKCRVKLESVFNHLIRELQVQYSVIDIETDQQHA